MVLLLTAVSAIFVSPLIVPVVLAGFALLWLVFRFPVGTLGLLLAYMPVDYMVIELGKFAGLPAMSIASALTKEVPLLLLLFIFCRRNGVRLVAADWCLVGLITIACIRTTVDGALANLAVDFQFILPYAIGRAFILTPSQEARWAGRAVWIIAILAVLGMTEVFIFGEIPRTVLYLATDSVTENGTLTAAFGGTGMVSMREASTMVGPAYFGALCMIALVLWWVYCRNPLPAAMAGAGLICSVTRSAWVGTGLAILVLAFKMKQWSRLAFYTALGVAMFLASIPILGLSDFLYYSKTGQDQSTQLHQASVLTGLEIMANSPLGTGNKKIGAQTATADMNATWVETTYVAFGAEYGIAAALCFLGFFVGVFWRAWQSQSRLGYATLGILVGVGFMMTVLLMHMDRRFTCWVWFPVGLMVRASQVPAPLPLQNTNLSGQTLRNA